jgi:hypothetical protein
MSIVFEILVIVAASIGMVAVAAGAAWYLMGHPRFHE